MERRLVTILAADAVGYSRLVANDEEAALALFDECSAAMTDLVRKYHGRVFGGAGDSLIAEFTSPVEALRCAVQMQREVAGINEKLAEERRMQFRVGLNLGDAVVEQGVLFGDAVNIASRLEGLCAPGGVCISGKLYEHVNHLPDFGFQDLGLVKLKNIPEQVHAYAVQGTSLRPFGRRRVRWAWAAAAAVAALAAAGGLWRYMPFPPENGGVPQQPALASHPSIAVLPLENLSGDPQQEYFSDGLTNDITTDLSKFPDLLVVASNSAFTFKGRHTKVQEIGAELGVRYLLEGTMQKTAGRLRINAQLIDVTSGMHLWADRYDREAEDFFDIQDEITQQIVKALALNVSAAEQRRVNRKETKSLGAYDYYLKGKEVVADPDKYTAEGNDEARLLFEKAVELDPQFSRPYTELAYLYVREAQSGWSDDSDASLAKAEELAKKALAINDDFDGHWSLAIVYWNQGEFQKSFIEYDAARRLNPNDPDLAAEEAEALIYGGEPEKAIVQIKEAMRRNPKIPYWYWWNLGRAYYMAGKYQEAIDAIGQITDPPEDVLLITAASKAQLGDLDAAKSDIAEFSAYDPEWSIAKSADYYYRNDSDRQHWLDGLRKAGLKEN